MATSTTPLVSNRVCKVNSFNISPIPTRRKLIKRNSISGCKLFLKLLGFLKSFTEISLCTEFLCIFWNLSFFWFFVCFDLQIVFKSWYFKFLCLLFYYILLFRLLMEKLIWCLLVNCLSSRSSCRWSCSCICRCTRCTSRCASRWTCTCSCSCSLTVTCCSSNSRSSVGYTSTCSHTSCAINFCIITAVCNLYWIVFFDLLSKKALNTVIFKSTCTSLALDKANHSFVTHHIETLLHIFV